jgi:hypothetical protein
MRGIGDHDAVEWVITMAWRTQLPWWLNWIFGPTEPPIRITRRQPRPDNPPGSSALSGLLCALDEVAEQHAEIFDTDVRERMWEVIQRRYLRLEPGFAIPAQLGMFSEAGNRRLRETLEHHLLGNLLAVADAFGLDTEAKRLRMIRNPAVKSEPRAYTFEDFFGAR